MAASPIQIFVSYAHADDAVPQDGESARGFVATLCDELKFSFGIFGEPRVRLWRDTRRLDSADQFDQIISEAISASDLFVVILSSNWMNSEYCRKELKAFSARWAAEGANVKQRIIVVGKRDVEKERRPSLLQDQTGCLFYARNDPDEIGLEREFFARGAVRDNRFHERVEELAGIMWRRARKYAAAGDDGQQAQAPETRKRGAVYVARPAADMRDAYSRLVSELTSSGYSVVPDQSVDLPTDASIIQVVDEALASVDVSIHLLGEKQGFAPDDADPIVKLQLARARHLATAGGKAGFRRLIWAPKFLPADHADDTAATARNPSAVLARFDEYLENDTIDGDTLSKFVELVAHRLAPRRAPQQATESVKAGSKVYVYHRDDDIDYALEVVRALRARDVFARFPAYEGSDAEKVQHHFQHLRDCDSVLLCWANAPDVWIKSQANGLADWKVLGRSREFDRRALVAGPPPGRPKKTFVELFPKDEIDMVLDLTARPQPQPDDFSPLLAAQ